MTTNKEGSHDSGGGDRFDRLLKDEQNLLDQLERATNSISYKVEGINYTP